jgi:hypothetical protein
MKEIFEECVEESELRQMTMNRAVADLQYILQEAAFHA